MSAIIEDYLRAVRRQISHLPLKEQSAVMAEIETHLKTETKRLRGTEKELSADEAALRATHAFGDPKELGVAYGAGGGVVNRTTGQVLLDVAILTSRAAGRGVRGTLKWTGIVAAAAVGVAVLLLLVGLVFAGVVLNIFQDDIRESIPRPLYDYSGTWAQTSPYSDTVTDSFQVREGVREFQIAFRVNPASITGPGCLARIVLTAPDGTTAYDSGATCTTTHQTRTLSQKGTWTIQYTYVAYAGSVSVEAMYYQDVRQA